VEMDLALGGFLNEVGRDVAQSQGSHGSSFLQSETSIVMTKAAGANDYIVVN
jgi:hypothetical protein